MWRSLRTTLALAVFLLTHNTAGHVLLIANGSTFNFDSSEANFAPHVKGAGISGFVMFGNPADACSSLETILTTLQASSSPFLLTMRGNCSFEAKVRYAQDAGFAAVIIYNNDSSSDLVTMAGSSEGISIHAVFVTRAAGEALAQYADDVNSDVWILPSYENTVWSVMVFSLISFLAIAAVLVTWYIVKRHMNGQLGSGYTRHEEPCVMTSRIVQAMPSVTYRVLGNEKAAQETCAICLEDYISGEMLRILPCSHRFHSSCVDAWLTMWRAVCPICKRDARFEFPDLQTSERTPLLSFISNGGRVSHGALAASSSESPPIQIPPTQADSQVGCMDIPSCSKGTASSSHTLPFSVSNSANRFRHSTTLECSLEAFRASPYFTPPSLSHNASPLLPGSYAAPCLLDCSPAASSPLLPSCSSPDPRSRSFINPSKAGCASPAVGSSSPLSYGSCSSRSVSFLNPIKARSTSKLVLEA